MTPNTVSSITPTALKDIYGNRKAFKKSIFYEALVKAEGGTSTFTARDEAVHDVKRRLLSHAFSERAVQDYEQHVSRNIDKWLDALGAGPLSSAGWTAEKNASTWIGYLTFDILTDLAYGRSFDLLGKNDMRFAAELAPNASMGLYQVSLSSNDLMKSMLNISSDRPAPSDPNRELDHVQNTTRHTARMEHRPRYDATYRYKQTILRRAPKHGNVLNGQ